MTTKLFDNKIASSEEQALDFIGNILESSTEYSIIGKDLEGKILLWNEGARRLYGYEPEEVVGSANSSILHVPEDVQAGKPREIMESALREGKWEGTIVRRRKNDQRFTARVVLTPRRDASGRPIGFPGHANAPSSRWAGPPETASQSSSSGITASASTPSTRTSYSASSSGCTARKTSKGPAWVWLLSSGLSTSTAGASGPKRNGATFFFTLGAPKDSRTDPQFTEGSAVCRGTDITDMS